MIHCIARCKVTWRRWKRLLISPIQQATRVGHQPSQNTRGSTNLLHMSFFVSFVLALIDAIPAWTSTPDPSSTLVPFSIHASMSMKYIRLRRDPIELEACESCTRRLVHWLLGKKTKPSFVFSESLHPFD